jgi:hypothetical protein
MFKVTKVYSDDAGDTHFSEVEIALNEAGSIGRLSDPHPAKSVVFREVLPSYDWDFHCAPERQYIILLDGEIEIETSLGDKKRFKGGDILLMEDVSGKGHKTRNILPEVRKSLFITI